MPTVLLVRHGRTTANASGILAGWSPGVFLDETGEAQADRVAARIAPLHVCRIVSSPLDRCAQTADRIAAASAGAARRVDDRLGECGYGAWTGRPLAELAKDPLWPVIQRRPSSVQFPDGPGYAGESFPQMQARVVAAIRDHDAAVATQAGAEAIWVAVSHGDLIKLALADALAMPLDEFQRLHVDPGSVSAIRWTDGRAMVVRVNDRGEELAALARPPGSGGGDSGSGGGGAEPTEGDAVVGGGAG